MSGEIVAEPIKNEEEDFALTVIEDADNWEVNDQDDYDTACEVLKGYKASLDARVTEFEPGKKKTYDAYQDALKRYNKFTKPFVTAIEKLKGKCTKFLTDENNKRIKAEKEAEAKLLKEQEDAEKAAKKAEKKGETPAPAPAPVPFTPPTVPAKSKVKGVSNPEKWKAEITDHGKLLAHIAKGVNKNDQFKEAVEKAFLPWLQKHATANQDAIPIPGVEFKTVIGMTVRA